MGGDKLGDADLIGFGRGGAKGECDVAETQLEQPVAAPRLAVIVTLRCCPAQDFDLAIIEAEPLIDPCDLRFGCALVGQKDARRSEEHTSELQSLMRISY